MKESDEKKKKKKNLLFILNIGIFEYISCYDFIS